VSVLDETRRRLAAQDPARAAAVEVEAGLAVAYGPAGAFADAERRLRQAAERAVLPVPLQIAASFGREWAEICADGRLPRRRARRLRATIEAQLDPALEALGPSHVVFTYAGMVLGTYGDLEAALDVVRTVIDTARGRGDVLAELMAIALRGRLFWYLGRLGEAESDGRIAFDAGTELAYPVLRGFAGATLAYAQAHRNELDEADAVLALFDLDGARDDATTIDVTLYGARAELRWAQGRPADALDDVETYFAVYARGDGVPPFMSVRALRTRALIALGRMDEARNWAREEVDRFRAEESAPEALGMSLAALGLAGGGAAGLALLDEAVAVLRHSQRRLELGRALIDQGAALRRARRRAEAREPLREGMEIAAVSGAPALVETARQELEATGARPRRVFRTGVDALTPSERRIASMAATGMTNSQIAQALFVTPKTVETHLRHVFQKLDVSSRGELGERLAA
jgi:DNA-binding CsgD family transcriptional regulator